MRPLFPVARGHEKLVRAEGLEPSPTLRSNGLSYIAVAQAFHDRIWSNDAPRA